MKDMLWIAAFAGAATFGIVILAATMLRSRPALPDAVDRMTTPPPVTPESELLRPKDFKSKVGVLVDPYLARYPWARSRPADLRILRTDTARYLGDKTLSALAGVVMPPIGALAAAQFGVSVAWELVVFGAVSLGALLFVAPDIEIRRKAATARREFAEHLQVYLDLVTLNRISGVGAMQSLERAALVGDSWVFRRLTELLQRAQLAGQTPWNAMTELAEQLSIPQLADLGDIMTVSGESGASVADNLRARSRAQRHEMISAELSDAEIASEKLRIPNAGMAIVLVAIVLVPAITNVMTT
ncbi:type II secretion system F family protein [Nocardia sp. NPDC006044]|uniref:type II secretion system F family protein n=1 Tax=Nocardia sp. NPDC006044 TaxID=3364306 RepID=UPI0036BC23EF